MFDTTMELPAVYDAKRAIADPDLVARARRLVDKRVLDYAKNSQAATTRRSYDSFRRSFARWCQARDVTSLPAEPETVAAWISERADKGELKAGSIAVALAAIRDGHRQAGYDSPTDAKAVKMVAAGIRRSLGTAQRQVEPLVAEKLVAIIAKIDTATLIGKRDVALLSLAMAGAFRRSEVVALDVADVEFGDKGIDILIRKSKTDQQGAGQQIAIPHGKFIRPVAALTTWLESAGISEGAIFRRVRYGGHVTDERLTGRALARIVKARCAAAGFDPDTHSAHSARAGFTTSAAEAGAALDRIMATTRHVDPRTVMKYIRRAERFSAHAGERFL